MSSSHHSAAEPEQERGSISNSGLGNKIQAAGISLVFELDANRTAKARQNSGFYHILGTVQYTSTPVTQGSGYKAFPR